MTTIHPESRLGRLFDQVERARAAHQTATDALATYQTEAGELDRWLEAADLDTPDLEYAKRNARRAKYANVMARTREALKAHSQSLAQLQKQYAPQQDRYIELSRELVALEDQTNPYTRQLSLRDLDRRLSEIRGWLSVWTEPEAATVDALEPVEA
jgi:chromosome segregation ATPase